MTLFASYEIEGLNTNNLTHIFTLQYMFMPRKQEVLNNFKAYWNNHPLETENIYMMVADFMIHHRGVGRGLYLTGSSRFNTRYIVK